MTIVLAAAAASLFGCGTYLLLQRQLTRILIGLALLAHGANLLIVLTAGGRGQPTFIGTGDADGFLDPLPQAFVLTAIVITFGVTGFLLALAYRSWVLTHDDDVQDDVEDRLVARRTEAEDVADARAAAAEAAAHTSDSQFEPEAPR
ncbi:MAG TPA: NADH-quinone oxidoreductase subunit K [Acidimicrobiales bacterium]|nr:NADH-quinone oxidoreductase subunit K [Acidimicrobiales bacterium]